MRLAAKMSLGRLVITMFVAKMLPLAAILEHA